MVAQACIDLSSVMNKDFLHMIDSKLLNQTNLVFSLKEIQQTAETFLECNNTKLMENNGICLGQPAPPCAVMVQPANPDSVPNSTQVLGHDGPVSPEMMSLQSVSPSHSVESALSPYSSEVFTAGSDSLQRTKAKTFSVQPVSLGQHNAVACSPVPCSLADPQTSVKPVTPHCSLQIKDEAAPVQSPCDTTNAPKKLEQKRKYSDGAASPCNGLKKPKLYELGPLSDEMEEKKRQCAINAKRHRDKQKNERDLLAKQVMAVTAERDSLQADKDSLQADNDSLRAENDSLRKQLQQLQQRDVQLLLTLANEHQNVLL